jgi:hypothetical protein
MSLAANTCLPQPPLCAASRLVARPRRSLFTAARIPTGHVLPPRLPNATLSVDRNTSYYVEDDAKVVQVKDELFYSHGLLPVDESKTSIRRFCLSFGRENVQSDAQRDVPGAQPAVTAAHGREEEVPREHESVVFFGLLARPHRGALRALAPETVGALQPRVERKGAVGGDQQCVLQEGKITAHFARRDPSTDAKVVTEPVGDIRRYCTFARKTAPCGLRLVWFYTRSGRDRMAMTGRTRAATPAATTVMTKARPRNMCQGCLPGQRLLA